MHQLSLINLKTSHALVISHISHEHQGINSTVQYDGSISQAFGIKSGVKKGCGLVPTLFRYKIRW